MLRVLNLGAGVQSTTLYLWALDGHLQIDRAIFADTGDEPEAVYRHLDFLKSLGGPEIEVVKPFATSLSDNLIHGIMPEEGAENLPEFVRKANTVISIPTFLSDDSRGGMGRRQCTGEFKIKPIERRIRELCGLAPGQRSKESVSVQIMGLSFDEPKRVVNVKSRFQSVAWTAAEFPLFDEFMTRADCVAYLEKRLPEYTVPRSACVFCPYHSDAEWRRVKSVRPDWEKVVAVDRALRDPASVCFSQMENVQYLHRSRKPIEEVEFVDKPQSRQSSLSFSTMDCEGMCGV
jgi:hypothetical protein